MHVTFIVEVAFAVETTETVPPADDTTQFQGNRRRSTICEIFSPPPPGMVGYSSRRTHILLMMFFGLFVCGTLRRYISELPRPIAVKLSDMIGSV